MDTGAILTKKEVGVGGVSQVELGKVFWGHVFHPDSSWQASGKHGILL